MRESDIQDFRIIESTLREGEQFVGADFTTQQKMKIAQALDAFGVEYLELTSPVVSPQSYEDIKLITGMGLRAKILTHIRCSRADAARAMELPLDGVDIVIGTSSLLRNFPQRPGRPARGLSGSRRDGPRPGRNSRHGGRGDALRRIRADVGA